MIFFLGRGGEGVCILIMTSVVQCKEIKKNIFFKVSDMAFDYYPKHRGLFELSIISITSTIISFFVIQQYFHSATSTQTRVYSRKNC